MFIYARNICIVAQVKKLETIECILKLGLSLFKNSSGNGNLGKIHTKPRLQCFT